MKNQLLKYLMSLPVLLANAGGIIFEGLSAQTWWADLPWGAINCATLVLIASFLIQDIFAPQSWLRRSWFDWRSPYTLEGVILNDEYDPSRIVIRASVRFKRVPTTGRARFSVRQTQGIKAGAAGAAFDIGLGDPHVDVLTKIDIGVLMISYPHWTPRRSVWGASIGPENVQKICPIYCWAYLFA